MLQKLSDHIANCLARAADLERRAAEASDPSRSDYERMAEGWRRLASSYQVVESLDQFLVRNKKLARPSAPSMEAEIRDEYARVAARSDDARQEAEHRTKNVLATVLATIDLSKSDTCEGLKQVIKGRIQALANVHALFVQSRWMGAELSSLAMQELAPHRR